MGVGTAACMGRDSNRFSSREGGFLFSSGASGMMLEGRALMRATSARADEEGGGLTKGVQLAFDGVREHADSLSDQQVDRGTQHEAAVVGGHRMSDECIEHCISKVCGAQPGDISILL